jgi:hypothetical protein
LATSSQALPSRPHLDGRHSKHRAGEEALRQAHWRTQAEHHGWLAILEIQTPHGWHGGASMKHFPPELPPPRISTEQGCAVLMLAALVFWLAIGLIYFTVF